MVQNVIKFLLNGFAVCATAYVLSGVQISSYYVALIVALILALLNILIKPMLLIFSLPINVLTFGLFTFFIDAFIVVLASRIVPGFHVDSFWTAMLFSIVLTLISSVLHKLIV